MSYSWTSEGLENDSWGSKKHPKFARAESICDNFAKHLTENCETHEFAAYVQSKQIVVTAYLRDYPPKSKDFKTAFAWETDDIDILNERLETIKVEIENWLLFN